MRDEADAAARGGMDPRIAALDPDGALRCLEESGRKPRQSGLPAAVGADDQLHPPRRHGQ